MNQRLNNKQMIPEEIKKKIDGYLQAQKSHVSGEGLENIRIDILYGYSLASEQLTAAEARINELEKGLQEIQNTAFYKEYLQTGEIAKIIDQLLNK